VLAWPKTAATLLACLLYAATGVAQAQQRSPALRVNLDYLLIAGQPADTGEKIEVIDFFWYGCPGCNAVQPALEAWIKRKPSDVILRRIPAIRHDAWAPHARIYYTLEALGEIGRLHQEVYRGYHVEQLHMSKPDVMEQWAVRHGIPRDRWAAAYGSAETQERLEHAKEATRHYKVPATPTLVVDGRYLTSGGMAQSAEEMISILERLIIKVRADRAENKK
jgi:thiol:disulfide interchange protein DsbA